MTDLLDALMAEVLAKMSVISEQKARTYDGVTVHGGEKPAMLPLVDKPLVDSFRDRYNGAHSLRARREVVLAATDALRVARKTPLPVGMEPEYGSAQWKRWVGESDESAESLAQRSWNPKTGKPVGKRYINMVRQQYRREAA